MILLTLAMIIQYIRDLSATVLSLNFEKEVKVLEEEKRKNS